MDSSEKKLRVIETQMTYLVNIDVSGMASNKQKNDSNMTTVR